MKFISLDISTNTGYAVFEENTLISFGVFTRKVKDYKADIGTYKDLPECYPDNFLDAVDLITKECLRVIHEHGINIVVIEHPESGKQRLSQRLLEWIHLTLVRELKEQYIPFKYILVNDWRNVVKCYLKYWTEYRNWNKQVKKARNIAVPTKTGMLVPKIDGKRVSAINQKKLSIIIANEHYDLDIKDDNIADAINMGRAAKELGIV